MYSNTPRLERHPESTASPFWDLTHRNLPCIVTEDDRCFSYTELQQQVDPIKAAFAASSKLLIFVLCSHSVASLAGYLACLQAGHAVLLLPHDMDLALLEPLLAVYRPDYVWSPAEIGANHADSGLGMDSYRLYQAETCGTGSTLHPELALMLTTSGSTGNPKVVRLSYANLQANAESIAEYLEIGPDDRPVTSMPMHYSYGLSVINSHLLKGATILQTGKRIRTPEFWDFARTHGATSLAGVPYVYQILHEMDFSSIELPSLRSLTQAGGYLDVALQDHFIRLARSRGIRYYTMYGQTEATARISYVPCDRAEEGAGSIGLPIPGGRFEIVEGELVYSGPNVMLGYAENREDLAKGDELQGRLFTGDMARFGDNGFCYVVGRKKRFIKPMGLRVNLDDVERQLSAHLQQKCVVVGTDSCLRVIATSAEVEERAIDFIRTTYHITSKLCAVHVVAEIPMLPTGKVDYGVLHAWMFGTANAISESRSSFAGTTPPAGDVEVVPFASAGPVAEAV